MRGWKIFFALAALNNLAVGAALLIGAEWFVGAVGVTGAGATYLVGFAGLVIAVFGVGYGLAALDPIANRALIVVGALGKAGAVVLTSWHAMAGHIAASVYLATMTDLVWALIFVVFLERTRTPRTSAPAPATGSG